MQWAEFTWGYDNIKWLGLLVASLAFMVFDTIVYTEKGNMDENEDKRRAWKFSRPQAWQHTRGRNGYSLRCKYANFPFLVLTCKFSREQNHRSSYRRSALPQIMHKRCIKQANFFSFTSFVSPILFQDFYGERKNNGATFSSNALAFVFNYSLEKDFNFPLPLFLKRLIELTFTTDHKIFVWRISIFCAVALSRMEGTIYCLYRAKII